jgi:hypothetical protein
MHHTPDIHLWPMVGMVLTLMAVVPSAFLLFLAGWDWLLETLRQRDPDPDTTTD